MQTTETNNRIFVHHGDYSGDIDVYSKYDPQNKQASIPMQDILEFVAEYIRSTRISILEQMQPEEIIATVIAKDLVK